MSSLPDRVAQVDLDYFRKAAHARARKVDPEAAKNQHFSTTIAVARIWVSFADASCPKYAPKKSK